jgi:hypothetical protein
MRNLLSWNTTTLKVPYTHFIIRTISGMQARFLYSYLQLISFRLISQW